MGIFMFNLQNGIFPFLTYDCTYFFFFSILVLFMETYFRDQCELSSVLFLLHRYVIGVMLIDEVPPDWIDL